MEMLTLITISCSLMHEEQGSEMSDDLGGEWEEWWWDLGGV